MNPITIIPLSLEQHVPLLQAVYESTPAYWALYRQSSAPSSQAAHDLHEAAETPGRTIMGILRRLQPDNGSAGLEMIGMIDMRLHHPDERTVTLGMVMVAQPFQRQGIGRQAWSLLEPWLAQAAGIRRARTLVEQFNTAGLRYFVSLGFELTGEAKRTRVGERFIRLLTMEKGLLI